MDFFWSRVAKAGNNDCWEWIGGKTEDGYGKFKLNKKNWTSHRYAWFLTNGEIPKGMYVLHSCDNKPCVNPKHLRAGTAQDNMDDKALRGRSVNVYGEAVGTSKLTEKEVLEIRDLGTNKVMNYLQIANAYGVKRRCICQIVNRKAWKHI